MNNRTLLERVQIKHADPAKLETHQVFQHAETRLGYKHPRWHRQIEQGPLADALRALEIRPFTQESVARYKSDRLRRCKRRAIVARGLFFPFVLLVAIPTTCLTVVCLFGLSEDLVRAGAADLLMRSFSAWVIPIAVITMILWIRYELVKDETGHWVKTGLHDYHNPMPESALAAAVEIQKRVPGIGFGIDELIIDGVLRDRFIFATINGESYYLEALPE